MDCRLILKYCYIGKEVERLDGAYSLTPRHISKL